MNPITPLIISIFAVAGFFCFLKFLTRDDKNFSFYDPDRATTENRQENQPQSSESAQDRNTPQQIFDPLPVYEGPPLTNSANSNMRLDSRGQLEVVERAEMNAPPEYAPPPPEYTPLPLEYVLRVSQDVSITIPSGAELESQDTPRI